MAVFRLNESPYGDGFFTYQINYKDKDGNKQDKKIKESDDESAIKRAKELNLNIISIYCLEDGEKIYPRDDDGNISSDQLKMNESILESTDEFIIGEKYWATCPPAGRNKQSCGTLLDIDGDVATLFNPRHGEWTATLDNLRERN